MRDVSSRLVRPRKALRRQLQASDLPKNVSKLRAWS